MRGGRGVRGVAEVVCGETGGVRGNTRLLRRVRRVSTINRTRLHGDHPGRAQTSGDRPGAVTGRGKRSSSTCMWLKYAVTLVP